MKARDRLLEEQEKQALFNSTSGGNNRSPNKIMQDTHITAAAANTSSSKYPFGQTKIEGMGISNAHSTKRS